MWKIKTTSSFTTKEDNTNYIRINVFELYDVLKSAIMKYRQELVKNEELRDKFILAWESIENYARDITADKDKSREAKTLFSELNATRNHLVLWEGRLNKDINKNLEAKQVKSDSIANYSPLT